MKSFRTSFLFIPLLLLLFAATERSFATGALFIRPLNSSQTYQKMSIKSYDATVEIEDQIAVTHVDQLFTNKLNSRVESTFIFPLPEGAVITELIYWFNGKRYTASLREREEAQKAYDTRVRQLIDPALLQYIGDNVFKLNIAPIDPLSLVRFEITYAELLPYEFGAVQYRFPLQTTGLSPDPLERVSVKVEATTRKTFKSFTSPSHGNTPANGIEQIAPNEYHVTFGDENFIPDSDLLLRFETRREGVDINLLTYTPTSQDSFGVESFYALWITPPDSVTDATLPRNIVFTADISSSMEGKRIEQLKEALGAFLDGLQPTDRFNIVVFSTTVMTYRADLVEATAAEIAQAHRFVEELGALGLTNIDDGLARSLRMTFPDGMINTLVFMTDGYPTWGEMDLKKIADSAVARNNGRVRIFPFGIGEEISKPLLNDLAQRNGGYPTFINSDDSIAMAVGNYFRRISQPVLAGLSVDYGGQRTFDRYPSILPDLFWGSQVLQFGRYRDSGVYTIVLQGNRLGEEERVSNTAHFPGVPGGNRAVARLWAKQKIDNLLGQIAQYGEKKELVDAVIDLSMRFGILTPYTAFYVDPTDPNASSAPDGTEDMLLPNRPIVERNYPNPFTDRTRISFLLPPGGATRASITIYDFSGRPVRVLLDRELPPGRHEISWDGRDDAGNPLPSGTYLCRLESEGREHTRTIVLIR